MLWVVDVELIDNWLKEVDADTYDQVIAALEILAEQGPGLGRPLVDSIGAGLAGNQRWSRSHGQRRSPALLAQPRTRSET